MINRGVNARCTVYRICKWGEYQSEFDNSVNAQYTLGKRSVNSQYNSNKNKDIRNKNNIVEIQNIYDLYIKEFEKNPNQLNIFRNLDNNLLITLINLSEIITTKTHDILLIIVWQLTASH